MQPKLIITPFGENANPATINEIPESPRPNDEPQQATWTTGFPLVTMTYPAAGGLPPFGQDMNGVLNAISSHIAFTGSGGQYKWSSDYVAAKGGYAQGSVVQSDDGLMAYVSTIDNNAINFNVDPSSIGNQWRIYSGPPSFASLTGKPTTLAGYGITNAYTKIESDARYAFVQDVYSKVQSDSRFYTKIESDARYAFVQDVYNKNQTNALLAEKVTADWIQSAGFVSNDVNLPYFRRSSDGQIYHLQRADNRVWQNLTASRSSGVSYTNSTGRAIELFIRFDPLNNDSVLVVGGISIQIYDSNQEFINITIPNGTSYLLTTWGSATPMLWLELR